MKAPGYSWTCHKCQAVNAADISTCVQCGFPAFASGGQIVAAQPKAPTTVAPEPSRTRSSKSRKVFFAVLLVTLPGLLWQAFEMYGLTFFGPQMLFFSILHTSPVISSLVLLAVPLALVALLLSCCCLGFPRFRALVGIGGWGHIAVVAYLTLHATLLLTYEFWSYAWSRQIVCIAGFIALCAAALMFVLQSGIAPKTVEYAV